MDLATAIRQARGTRSRNEFAALLGCGYHAVYRWERGEQWPRSQAHIRLLIEQGVPEELFDAPAQAATVPAVAS